MIQKTKNKFFVHQGGLSLIEVMISMGILVALFALYTAALNTMNATKSLRFENVAYHVANKKMEELRGTAFTSLPSSGTINDSMLSQIPSGAGSFAVANYVSYSGMKEITVIVTWTERGINKQFELKTLAGSGGINP